MGKVKAKGPKKAKKQKKPLDAAVASSRAVAVKAGIDASLADKLKEGQVPECIKKMQSDSAEERENGLLAVTHLVLQPRHTAVLLANNAAGIAAQLLCNDSVAPIRAAAAAALRNIVLTVAEGDVDSLYPSASFDLVGGVARCLAAAIEEATRLETTPPEQVASNQQQQQPGENEELLSPEEEHEGLLRAAYKDIEEFLQVATVFAESNDAAAEAFGAWRSNGFLASLVQCLVQCEKHVTVQQAAAECLKVLAEDSENVASFIAQGMPPAAQQFLNTMVSSPPSSPSLLRVAVNLCGALLSVGPTAANVSTVMPVLVAAVQTSPPQVVQRLVPLMSSDCELDAVVREMGVAQNLDRLRATQAALQALSEALAIVCEEQPEDEDDESAFARNPAATIITSSGLLPALLERSAETLVPPTDPVLRAVLHEPSDSGDVTTLQRLMASVEVGVLGLTSSFMVLLPLAAFGGSIQSMWTLIGTAIDVRHTRLNEAVRASRQAMGLEQSEDAVDASGVASAVGLLCLPLQIESLVEMAATLQRKDVENASQPQVAQLDTFTRLAWNPAVTGATRSHVMAIVGSIGARVQDPACVYACGNFCTRIMAKAAEEAASNPEKALSNDMADVGAEALNSIMDLFASEDHDESTFVPLNIFGTIQELLPALKRHVQAIKSRRGSAAWLRKQHLDEIASNASRFLQYKRENCPAIAQQAAGKKYRPS